MREASTTVMGTNVGISVLRRTRNDTDRDRYSTQLAVGISGFVIFGKEKSTSRRRMPSVRWSVWFVARCDVTSNIN